MAEQEGFRGGEDECFNARGEALRQEDEEHQRSEVPEAGMEKKSQTVAHRVVPERSHPAPLEYGGGNEANSQKRVVESLFLEPLLPRIGKKRSGDSGAEDDHCRQDTRTGDASDERLPLREWNLQRLRTNALPVQVTHGFLPAPTPCNEAIEAPFLET